jgi:hypothetical protein
LTSCEMAAGSSTEICGEPETPHNTLHELRNWDKTLVQMLTRILQKLK